MTDRNFIRKPTPVLAIQYSRDSLDELEEIPGVDLLYSRSDLWREEDWEEIAFANVRTPSGIDVATPGDWIVVEEGRLSVYSPELFDKSFTPHPAGLSPAARQLLNSKRSAEISAEEDTDA